MRALTVAAALLFAALAAGCGPSKDQVMRAGFDCAEETASTGPAFEYCIQRKGMTEALRDCRDCQAVAVKEGLDKRLEVTTKEVDDLSRELSTNKQTTTASRSLVKTKRRDARRAASKLDRSLKEEKEAWAPDMPGYQAEMDRRAAQNELNDRLSHKESQ